MAWNRRAKEAIFRRFLPLFCMLKRNFLQILSLFCMLLWNIFSLFLLLLALLRCQKFFWLCTVVDELFARYLKIGRTSWILKIFVVFNYFMHFSESNLILKKIFIKWIFAMLQKASNKQKVETILIHLVSWVLSKFIVSKNNYILY